MMMKRKFARAAVSSLSAIAGKEAVALLIEQLKEEKNRSVEKSKKDGELDFGFAPVLYKYFEALGKFGGDAAPAVPALIETLNELPLLSSEGSTTRSN